jgi:hypothetical protein
MFNFHKRAKLCGCILGFRRYPDYDFKCFYSGFASFKFRISSPPPPILCCLTSLVEKRQDSDQWRVLVNTVMNLRVP